MRQRYGPTIIVHFIVLALIAILAMTIPVPVGANDEQCAPTAVITTTVSQVDYLNANFDSTNQFAYAPATIAAQATQVDEIYVRTAVPPKVWVAIPAAMDLDKTEYITVDSRHYGGNLLRHYRYNYMTNSIMPAIARIPFANVPQMQRI